MHKSFLKWAGGKFDLLPTLIPIVQQMPGRGGRAVNVHCLIQNDRVEIFRGRNMIGTVVAIGEDEPVITIFSNPDGVQSLSFNDVAIIQDNWNQCEEMLKNRLTSAK